MTALTRRLSVVVLTAVAAALPASAARAYDVSYTDLPELQSATVVATTTAANASADTPAGTTIAFRFDESVATSSPDPSMFAVYDEQGHRSSAAAASVAGDTVTASFPTIDSEERESALTSAATRQAAVRDGAGNDSPVGSVGVTRWTSRRARGPQGCIRLKRVSDLRRAHGNTSLTVSIPTCGGWLGVAQNGFHLMMVDGRVIRSLRARIHYGLPATARVVFPGREYQREIGRLTVDRGALVNTHDDGTETEVDEPIALQALALSHHGNTVFPDLVSVQLLPNARPGRPDHALFTFDQAVKSPRASRFRLNDHARGTGAVVPPSHPRRVRVTFGPHAADAATFATVRAGALRSGRADEVAVPNVLWSSHRTGEYTALPDAENVDYHYDDANGEPVFTADFYFDAALDSSATPQAFHVYGKSGSRYDAATCTVTDRSSAPPTRGFVSCTFPTAPPASTAAYLATVDADGVHDDTGKGNAEASRWAFPE